MSPQPSRTTWPEYAARPVICDGCHQRVTLKQAWTCWWSEETQEGRVWHRECDPRVARNGQANSGQKEKPLQITLELVDIRVDTQKADQAA